jgi:hypothetical protein
MAKAAKAKAGGKKKAKSDSKALVTSAPKRGGKKRAGVKDFTGLLEHPLVTELLAVGAMAAVTAIAEHNRKDGDGKKTSKAVKSAGKAAAAAIGKRLLTEVDEIRKASKKASK